MARVKNQPKEDSEILEEAKKKVVVKEKKARPNYYWVRPKVTENDLIGLSKHGMSKWRDTVDVIQCAYDYNSKRWLTGLDEYDPKLISISDEEERLKKQAEVKELRESLEKQTGLNLSPNNDEFWSSYLITFSDKSRPFVPHLNPMDSIAIQVLKRRGDVPFGGGDLYNSKYDNSKWYIETEEAEAVTRTNRRKLEKEAIAASFELETDYDRLWKISYLLGLTKTVNESTQSLVEKVDEFIDRNAKYPDELERLLDLTSLDPDVLDGLSIFEKALKAGIVRFDKENKVFYRGGFNMKSNKMDSVKTMLLPDNTAYYIEIMEEVTRKEGYQRDTA